MVDRKEGPVSDGIRNGYSRHRGGADGWYREFGSGYTNPHEEAVASAVSRLVRSGWVVPGDRVLDLAAGSGEVWRALRSAGLAADDISACDPFTFEAFASRTGRACRQDSFAEIAAGSLAGLSFDRIICSYALHLCEPSRMPGLCMALAAVSPVLCVVTPHKRPAIAPTWGWDLCDEHYDSRLRVRIRCHRTRDAVNEVNEATAGSLGDLRS